jgi:uncharacterized repeat protein (TIGR01451 family)
VEVSVRVQPPRGELTVLPAARDSGAWWFDLPALMPGQYTLWVDGEDLAGNTTSVGPFTVNVTCTDAAPAITSLSAEPVVGHPLSLTLTVVLSNAGPDPLPAGLPVVLHEGFAEIGHLVSTVALAPGESQALSVAWAPADGGDYVVGVTVGGNAALADGPLCAAPATAHFSLPVRDGTLYYGGNLLSLRLNPSNTDVEVAQRGIDGPYTALLGYDGGLAVYDPDRPGESTLTTVDALHGYWVRMPITATLGDEAAGSWRMAGEVLPEDQTLSLASGWNLVGYLPRQPLTVTTALAGMAGQYAGVLGFKRTALSYYPDLDEGYNTLAYMAPGYGYWIDASQALAFAYPTTTVTSTLTLTATRPARARAAGAEYAEWLAGVQPTYAWANFYGELALPGGTPVPTDTIILAVDPQGVICGATMVWEPGMYGLLACYGDDPQTVADEGAQPGDVIELFVSSDGAQPDGQFVGTGLWTGHGERWEVTEGVLPWTDLAIRKQVTPGAAVPGSTITYTLVYTNVGDLLAQGVVISDPLPVELQATGYSASGAAVTPVAGSEAYAWQVEDLSPGQGGVITITAVLSPALASGLVLTNTAIITAPLEGWPEDNVAQAVLPVTVPTGYDWRIWLPLIMRQAPQ